MAGQQGRGALQAVREIFGGCAGFTPVAARMQVRQEFRAPGFCNPRISLYHSCSDTFGTDFPPGPFSHIPAKEAMAKKKRGGGAASREREPRFLGWRTTDADEVERRQWRGRTEVFDIENTEPAYGRYGTFKVRSSSGNVYAVEIRSLSEADNSCPCRDFEINGLGTCKHIEGVLHHLRKGGKRAFNAAAKTGSPRVEVFSPGWNADSVSVKWPGRPLPEGTEKRVGELAERLRGGGAKRALADLSDLEAGNPGLIRVSGLLDRRVGRRGEKDRARKRRERFLRDVENGRRTLDLLRFPLFPYQRDGMLHLAFGERALLADDMGLGKTVQALAACVLLRELESIERVLVVSPASLKSEWMEQIQGATEGLSSQIVSGRRGARLDQYAERAFFTLVNYEQVMSDGDDIQRVVNPDVIILDEAQRIKNWRTKTASAVKRLRSRFAFVLTGTPLENRIDEIYSIIEYLDPKILGPLFRFNRDHYVLDDRGRPAGYQNLDMLSERIRPVMLRRRKDEVEDELPDRTLNNYFTEMTQEQRTRYEEHEYNMARIAGRAKRRPLTPEEFKRLQLELACMRMTCDTPYILDPRVRDCPKLEELERVLEEILEDGGRKIIVFSEWVRMLDLVRERLGELDLDFALHTGSVSQDRRRAEINRFKQDPACRLFLSSESGGTGLNLQAASAVVNLDLPWNPAKLEQRIARAWRKNQRRSVTVINLVARDTIEHRMLYLLEQKQALADAVLDRRGDLKKLDIPTGRKAFLERLEKVMGEQPEDRDARKDPIETALAALRERFGSGLFLAELRRAEGGARSILAVLENTAAETASFDEDRGLSVEFISRGNYEAIRRLEAAGHLSFSSGRLRLLHETGDRENDPAELRRREALRLLEASDRQQRMARLLAGGGFGAEAAAQAKEIADLALRALAAMAPEENGSPRNGEESSVEICERLGETEFLPPELRQRALRICEPLAGEEKEETDERFSRELSEAEALLEHAREIIAE